MGRLFESGVRVVRLDEILSNPGSIAITFDDGFASVLEHAIPVLEKYRFPATIFVVSGYCGRKNDWPTQPAHVSRMPLMTWDDIRRLSEVGIQIGAHTVNHHVLTRLAQNEAEDEVRRCKQQIEDEIGIVVDTFAYPYGACSDELRALARREFRLACGTRMSFADNASDPGELPRIDAYYLRSGFQPADLLTFGGGAYVHARSTLRQIRSLVARDLRR